MLFKLAALLTHFIAFASAAAVPGGDSLSSLAATNTSFVIDSAAYPGYGLNVAFSGLVEGSPVIVYSTPKGNIGLNEQWILNNVIGSDNYTIQSVDSLKYLSWPGARFNFNEAGSYSINNYAIISSIPMTFTFELVTPGSNNYRIIDTLKGGYLTAYKPQMESNTVGALTYQNPVTDNNQVWTVTALSQFR